jgi:hypothetical protein
MPSKNMLRVYQECIHIRDNISEICHINVWAESMCSSFWPGTKGWVVEASGDGRKCYLTISRARSLFPLAQYEGLDVTGVLPGHPCRISFCLIFCRIGHPAPESNSDTCTFFFWKLRYMHLCPVTLRTAAYGSLRGAFVQGSLLAIAGYPR